MKRKTQYKDEQREDVRIWSQQKSEQFDIKYDIYFYYKYNTQYVTCKQKEKQYEIQTHWVEWKLNLSRKPHTHVTKAVKSIGKQQQNNTIWVDAVVS